MVLIQTGAWAAANSRKIGQGADHGGSRSAPFYRNAGKQKQCICYFTNSNLDLSKKKISNQKKNLIYLSRQKDISNQKKKLIQHAYKVRIVLWNRGKTLRISNWILTRTQRIDWSALRSESLNPVKQYFITSKYQPRKPIKASRSQDAQQNVRKLLNLSESERDIHDTYLAGNTRYFTLVRVESSTYAMACAFGLLIFLMAMGAMRKLLSFRYVFILILSN